MHGPIREPWVGFVHQVPKQSLPFPDLERLVQMPAWRDSVASCRGLWVLSGYVRQALRDLGVTIPVDVIPYATPMPTTCWTPDFLRAGEVYCVGGFLRNFQAFYDLDAGDRKKILLAPEGFDARAFGIVDNGSIEVRDRVDSATYEHKYSPARSCS